MINTETLSILAGSSKSHVNVGDKLWFIKGRLANVLYEDLDNGWCDIVGIKVLTDEMIFRDKSAAFVRHIQSHLSADEEVVCKICRKTVDEIYEEEKLDSEGE